MFAKEPDFRCPILTRIPGNTCQSLPLISGLYIGKFNSLYLKQERRKTVLSAFGIPKCPVLCPSRLRVSGCVGGCVGVTCRGLREEEQQGDWSRRICAVALFPKLVSQPWNVSQFLG